MFAVYRNDCLCLLAGGLLEKGWLTPAARGVVKGVDQGAGATGVSVDQALLQWRCSWGRESLNGLSGTATKGQQDEK